MCQVSNQVVIRLSLSTGKFENKAPSAQIPMCPATTTLFIYLGSTHLQTTG